MGVPPLLVSGCRDLSHHPWISDALLGHWATTGATKPSPGVPWSTTGRYWSVWDTLPEHALGGGSIIGEGAGAGLDDDADADDDGGVRRGTRHKTEWVVGMGNEMGAWPGVSRRIQVQHCTSFDLSIHTFLLLCLQYARVRW